MLKNTPHLNSQLFDAKKFNINKTTILDIIHPKLKTDKFSRYIEKNLSSLSKTQ